LAAIGQTMAGLAHESRNAFQRSQAALETLGLELVDKPDALQLVERIQRANDHLLHLYQEVLQFAKPVRLELCTCHLTDVAGTTCQHIVQAGHCQADKLQIVDANSPTVTLDPYAVEQILRNLIENAIAVSPEAEKVVIAITPSWLGRVPAIRVEIRDRGPGIAEEYRHRIFEPFFSTRSRGTGLGLPIARRLAEAHGGTLKLESSSLGTTAILELPQIPHGEIPEDPENQPDHRRSHLPPT
jgi:signal transduction histidine kinase